MTHPPLRLKKRLDEYAGGVRLGKGHLSILLVVTDHARNGRLPLDPADLRTPRKGQVRGAGKAAVQAILARHGITDVLAQEGGRTSRGSLEQMEAYVDLLNSLHKDGLADLDAIEAFWITKVRDVLSAKPFRLKLDSNRSLRSVIRDLLQQAIERQRTAVGRTDAGALLQHLVGAKLACAMQPDPVEHHSYSTADAQTARKGDFELGNTVVHVTTAPADGVISRCQKNLNEGLRPLLITLPEQTAGAIALAQTAKIADRIDILDIEQFMVLNLYEWRRFETADRRDTFDSVISRYNQIVGENETDPGLKIELG